MDTAKHEGRPEPAGARRQHRERDRRCLATDSAAIANLVSRTMTRN
jgi:hypothetical protein